MPALLDESSLLAPKGSMGTTSPSCDALADMSAGIVWATLRKKSNMYWREAGSYCWQASVSALWKAELWSTLRVFRAPAVSRGAEIWGRERGTNIDMYGIAVGEAAAHMSLREEAIGE